jgi:hypothetical protein
MHTLQDAIGRQDRRPVLSTLWIFPVLNYLAADVSALFFDPALQKDATQERVSRYIGSIQITQRIVFLTAIVLETALAMVVLFRVLPYGANCWCNILLGLFQTGWSAVSSGCIANLTESGFSPPQATGPRPQ